MKEVECKHVSVRWGCLLAGAGLTMFCHQLSDVEADLPVVRPVHHQRPLQVNG
jgi:hypothetical protein